MSTGRREGAALARVVGVALLLAAVVPAPARGGIQEPAFANGPRDAVTGRFVPSGPISPTSVRPERWVMEKRWGLAIPGMLGGNILPMIFNEFLQPWKEISRTGPETWSIYWNPFQDWEWDDNHFFNNQIFHPIQGNFYYNAARSNGFDYWWSSGFALVGSYLWECCSERRPGSYNDLVNTALGGAAVGEMLYRASSMILDNRRRGLDRVGTEALLLPLNAERFMARGVYRQWGDDVNPVEHDLLPGWSLSFASGMRDLGRGWHPLFDFELRYGGLLTQEHPDPFDHFVVNAQFNGQDQIIGLVQIRGFLATWRLSGENLTSESPEPGPVVKATLSQVYDYLDSAPDDSTVSRPRPTEGYRYGAQALSLGLVGSWPAFGSGRFEAELQGDFVPIGAVNSPWTYHEGRISERKREYDFGWGGGVRIGASLEVPSWWLRLEGSYKRHWLDVRNGSNNCGPPANVAGVCNETNHRVSLGSLGVKVELDRLFGWITGYPNGGLRDIWIGGDYMHFGKASRYTAHPDDHHAAEQWRVLVRWDISR